MTLFGGRVDADQWLQTTLADTKCKMQTQHCDLRMTLFWGNTGLGVIQRVGTDMIGVVLWTDCRQTEAVIWCEDQGELALYRNTDAPPRTGAPVDVGDLVSFDVETTRSMRLAHNPEVLQAGYHPELAKMLKTRAASDAANRPRKRISADIIPLFQNACCAFVNVTAKPAKTG